MKPRYRLFRKSATGSVAVEMAIILPIFLTLLAGPLFIARLGWFYSAGQKAAHDSTRFLATASQAELRTGGTGFNEARVAGLARWIAQEELGDIVQSTDTIVITIQCNEVGCGSSTPETVRTYIQIVAEDTIFSSLTQDYLGAGTVIMTSDVSMRYVGN